MIRPKLLVAIATLMTFAAHAQVLLPVTNNGLRNDLQKVVEDYLKGFSSLKGNVLIENPQTVEYASLLEFSGAEGNSITRYNSSKTIYSWQATMLTTEDFNEAVKKYKWLYNELKVMTIKLDDYSFSLSGEYDEPDESRKFSDCSFNLLPAAINLPKLKIEVTMQFEFPAWKVGLQVFQKEREDSDRGPVNE